MPSRIKPKGFTLSEFYVEGDEVKARYKTDHLEWITIAVCRTKKQAETLAQQLNQAIGVIEK